jgi:hypothetical protein
LTRKANRRSKKLDMSRGKSPNKPGQTKVGFVTVKKVALGGKAKNVTPKAKGGVKGKVCWKGRGGFTS